MKKAYNWIIILITLSLMVVAMAGCKKKSAEEPIETIIEEVSQESSADKESSAPPEESSESSSQESSQEASVKEESENPILENTIHDPNMNPLTGEIEDHEVANKRPLAFSINNHPDAVPAVGISDADIIFEAIVEGGATRMMAIFQEVPNNDTPIGSIRSLRHNYIDFAIGYDAIIVHCGGTDRAANVLQSRGVPDIEAISWAGGLFYRDPWRDANMGYVHSLVTTGEVINDFLENDASFRTEHEEDYRCNMLFSNEPLVVNGEVMTEMDVFFGDYRHSYFTFDAEENDYTMEEYDQTYIDYATDEPIHFKNVVVIRTDVWEFDGVHQDMALTGEGEGYFAVNGVCAPIKWSRADDYSQFIFTYPDGTPVVFGVGKTYIAVVDLEGGID